MGSREVKYLKPENILIIGLDEELADGVVHALADERASLDVDENMVKNIMAYGVIQPVSVRREAGHYYVVDGRQRVKAARVAAKRQADSGEIQTKVPCIEVTGDDNRVVGVMVSANEQRADDDILVKAAKASRMLDMVGSKPAVAIAFGRSTKTIDNWMVLLSAAPEVHQAVREGKISATVATKLAAKPREEQLVALAQILSDSPARKVDPAAEGKEKSSSSSSSSTKEHNGVKKGWLRKAMKTEAYNNLEGEQKQVLQWFLSGHIDQGHWIDSFMWGAEEEIGS